MDIIRANLPSLKQIHIKECPIAGNQEFIRKCKQIESQQFKIVLWIKLFGFWQMSWDFIYHCLKIFKKNQFSLSLVVKMLNQSCTPVVLFIFSLCVKRSVSVCSRELWSTINEWGDLVARIPFSYDYRNILPIIFRFYFLPYAKNMSSKNKCESINIFGTNLHFACLWNLSFLCAIFFWRTFRWPYYIQWVGLWKR